MKSWTITLRRVPVSQNDDVWRERWKQYSYKRDWVEDVGWQCIIEGVPRLEQIALSIVIYFPDQRHRDLDNYHPTTVKATQDALTPTTANKPYGIGIIQGDDQRYIPRLPQLTFAYDKKNPRTEITITEVLDEGQAS